jgi:hypothetical protein
MVTSAGIAAAPRRNRSVRVQIARGIGFTAALLVGLYVVLYVGAVLFYVNDDFNESTFHPNWSAIVPVTGVAVATWLVLWRARAWDGRPRWLVPCSLLVVTATLLIAFWPFRVTTDTIPTTCAAIADAWHPVVSEPAPADMRVWRTSIAIVPFVKSPYTDPVKRRAFYQQELSRIHARQARLEAMPAVQRAERYIDWTYTRGVCTPTARSLLIVSGGTLALGVGALSALTLRRRRSAERTS